jgi:uncharacterized repeat protein (TIGR01451 family)
MHQVSKNRRNKEEKQMKTINIGGVLIILAVLLSGYASAQDDSTVYGFTDVTIIPHDEIFQGNKYVCIFGQPWTLIQDCKLEQGEYTDNQTGLDLSNVGMVFPGPSALASAAGPVPVAEAVGVATAAGISIPSYGALTAASGVPLSVAIGEQLVAGTPIPDGGILAVLAPIPGSGIVLGPAAVVVDIACGYAGFSCKGSDITKNMLAHPEIQTFIIGWSKANQAQIGSAGVDNKDAMIKCAYGSLDHLAITWDGDIHTDLGPVDSLSIKDLVNDQNRINSMMKDHPALAVEMPLADRGMFPNLDQLRGHQILTACGYWVTDSNNDEGWNELHPVTSLIIRNTPDLAITPSAMNVVPGSAGIYSIKVTDRDSAGGSDTWIWAETFDNFVVSGLPSGWQTSFDQSSVTLNPGDSTTFTFSIKPFRDFSTAPGDYAFTVTGGNKNARLNGFTVAGSASATVHIPPFYDPSVKIVPSSQQIIPGQTANYTITVQNIGNVIDSIDLTVSGLPSSWQTSFDQSSVTLNPGDSKTFILSIKPLRDFSTSPGDYAFTVTGKSANANVAGSDSATVHVLPFYDPRIKIVPSSQQIKPGHMATYTITVQNLGNAIDGIDLGINYLDFGTQFRAFPTAIQPSWAILGDAHFSLNPGQMNNTTLNITAPSTWQGVENATYRFNATVTSETDPTANLSDTANLKIIATKESRPRFIELEISSLKHGVNASTIPPDIMASLLDKLDSAEFKNQQAITYILTSKSNLANNMLSSTIDIMSAFISSVQAQRNKGIPASLADNWISQAQTIISDIQDAITSS